MLDLGGIVNIKCKDEDKEAISALLIDRMAALYADSACLGYGEDEDEEHNESVRDTIEDQICLIEETESGLVAELMDICEGRLVLAWEVEEENNYMDEYGITEENTYKFHFEQIFKAYPEIEMYISLSISDPHTGGTYEIIYTENGKLIRKYALLCGGCGELFVPEDGFWYPEDVIDTLDREGFYGLCSRECAENLINDPENDKYDLLYEYEDQIKEALED